MNSVVSLHFCMLNFPIVLPQRKFSTFETLTGQGKSFSLREICQKNVISCLDMPLIKLMVSALEASGCKIDPTRHFACDICKPGRDIQNFGGYDEELNQVFFCADNATSSGLVHGVLLRNLIHMFDVCTKKVDFQNVDHLACMEVRKANLANCNYALYLARTDAHFAVKKQHQICVENTAVDFLVKTKFVDQKLAEEAVKRVFPKCYTDLEPIGRRSKHIYDMKQAEREKYLFGYE